MELYVESMRQTVLQHVEKVDELNKLAVENNLMMSNMLSELNEEDTSNVIVFQSRLMNARDSVEDLYSPDVTQETSSSWKDPFTGEMKKSDLLSHQEQVQNVKCLRPYRGFLSIDIDVCSDNEFSGKVDGIIFVEIYYKDDSHPLAVLTDANNSRVKVVNLNTRRVTTSRKTISEPYGICSLNQILIGVTLPKIHRFVIYRLLNPVHLEELRSMNTVNSYYGAASLETPFNYNILLVGRSKNQTAVDVFALSENNQQWRLNKTVRFLVNEVAVPRNVIITEDGKKNFVTDRDRGVIVFDNKGNILNNIREPILRDCSAICVDNEDNIYVGGLETDNVVKFAPDGKLIGEVINRSDGLKQPSSLCYVSSKNSLLVGCKSSNDPLFYVKL